MAKSVSAYLAHRMWRNQLTCLSADEEPVPECRCGVRLCVIPLRYYPIQGVFLEVQALLLSRPSDSASEPCSTTLLSLASREVRSSSLLLSFPPCLSILIQFSRDSPRRTYTGRVGQSTWPTSRASQMCVYNTATEYRIAFLD